MRWQGRRESSNVEDRRSSGGGFGGGRPTGIFGLIIILVGAYYGVDLSGLVGEVDMGGGTKFAIAITARRAII